MFRSISHRLAAIYIGLFVLAVGVLGASVTVSAHVALTRLFEARIEAEAQSRAAEFEKEGLGELSMVIAERERTAGALLYGVAGPGLPALGSLGRANPPLGWSNVRLSGPNGPATVRVLGVRVRDGVRLYVGDRLNLISTLNGVVLASFAVALAVVVLLGAVAGLASGRLLRRRFLALADAAEQFADGELDRRAPVRGSGDDLDELALALNRTLDRVVQLMESLRQVTDDIAHDLRTPLANLRQRLEDGLSDPDTTRCRQRVERAIEDLDGVLATFSDLLRIAEVERGARRAAFQRVDLTALAIGVVETFAPSAEEEGRSLAVEARSSVFVEGDAGLLTQMLVNLVENALRHTPPGAIVRVVVTEANGRGRLCVVDNGPGIPEGERARVFDRFYRLERSRSTRGSGLGMSLAAAVARLHGAEIVLDDAGPGLEASIDFPTL